MIYPKKQNQPGEQRKKKTLILPAIAGITALVLISALVFAFREGNLDTRRARLYQLKVPPDGTHLYRFMLREIPDIVSEIPCVCCGETLDACYKGACPPT